MGPKTEQELAAALDATGHEVVDRDGHFVLNNRKTGLIMVLASPTFSGALAEAWEIIKGRSACR